MCNVDERPVDDVSPVPMTLHRVTEVAIIPKVDKKDVVSDEGVGFSPTYHRMAKLLSQLHAAKSPEAHVLQSWLLVELLAANRCC